MGCDIHPAVEVRRKGVWRYHRPTEPCKDYNEVFTADDAKRVNENMRSSVYRSPSSVWKPVKAGDRKYAWDRCKTRLPRFFNDRNYELFSILANVRNDGDIEPIDEPRGLPPDVTPQALAKLSDEHSQTWVTLTELITYNVFVPIQWDEGDPILLADAVPQIDEWINYLVALVPKGGTTDDVRVVMDFDS